MGKKKNFVGDVTFVGENVFSVYGLGKMIQRIEDTLGEFQEPLTRAFKRAVQPTLRDVESFMAEHHRTGKTMENFKAGDTEWTSPDIMEYVFGFDTSNKNGGLPALFLEYGTPTQPAHFFMYYAVRNHQHQVNGLVEAEFQDILKERGLL